MKVAIIVDFTSDINNTEFDNYSDFPEISGERGLRKNYIGIYQGEANSTKKTVSFFNSILGADVKAATAAEIENIKQTQEYKNMAVYPAKDSIKVIDGVMVVNFCNNLD